VFLLFAVMPLLGVAQQPATSPQPAGNINGTVEDQTGAVRVGATVRLTYGGQHAVGEVLSGENGQFSFTNVAPGPFQLTVSSAGFSTQTFTGVLHPGETFIVPRLTLPVASANAEVQVGGSQVEVAEAQIKEEEKQRVLGFIPNFHVSYIPDAAPLTAKQKFELAWKSAVDPMTFLGVGVLAGFQQAADDFSGYGQGAQGYAKRYGAAYADSFAGSLIGDAILPSLLKQDPRYFYRGTGSTKSRIGYAIANAVICKGDNKKWQPNYSAIIASFATAGLSYAYYPASDRTGAGLVVQNAMIKIGGNAVGAIFQEFVVRKLTPHLSKRAPTQP
jgi:carboxypeptidase family protein